VTVKFFEELLTIGNVNVQVILVLHEQVQQQ